MRLRFGAQPVGSYSQKIWQLLSEQETSIILPFSAFLLLLSFLRARALNDDRAAIFPLLLDDDASRAGLDFCFGLAISRACLDDRNGAARVVGLADDVDLIREGVLLHADQDHY